MGKITIVGLGPGDESLISQGALDILKNSSNIYLRTEKHPTVDKLKEFIKYTNLDYFYENEDNFENVYREIAQFIIDKSNEGDLVYAVPGHPRVAERTVSQIESLAKNKGIEVEVIASMSFVDAMFNYLAIDPADGFKLVDAFEIENSYIDTNILCYTLVIETLSIRQFPFKLHFRYDVICSDLDCTRSLKNK